MTTITNEKPSERIRFAVGAAREFIKLENTVMDMTVFHNTVKYPSTGKFICIACLGGAAAIKKYGLIDDRNKIYSRSSLAELAITKGVNCEKEDICTDRLMLSIDEVENYESSLDAARQGDIHLMFWHMGVADCSSNNKSAHILSRDMPLFDQENPEELFCELEVLAKDLEKAGF